MALDHESVGYEILEMVQTLSMIVYLKLVNYVDRVTAVQLLKDALLTYVVLRYTRKCYLYFRGYGLFYGLKLFYLSVSKSVFKRLLALPGLRSKVDQQVSELIVKIEDALMVKDDKLKDFSRLPADGLSEVQIIEELSKLQKLKHTDWEHGRVSGAVYHGGADLIELQTKLFNMFCVSNQLHPDVFPGVRKMEAEVVSMVLKLFNAPETGCGATTSGGSESLILAILLAREYLKRYRGVTEPEIIAPETIHAAVDKLCYYFNIKLHHVPLDPVSYKVDLKTVKNLINSNTVLLLGSAPNFPHGIMDDISTLSDYAVKYNIPLHVDCCLGSFTMALLNKAGFDEVPIFDFRLPGVTSISCDTHKYGFAPKGSSIIMYRSPRLRECQYFITDSWIGGLYGSPGLAGSKNGAVIVGCWATMVSIGELGYIEKCKEIFTLARKLKKLISEIPGLQIIGDPVGSVVSFKSTNEKLSIYSLSDALNARGWHLSSLQKPALLHLATTVLNVPVIDDLILDIEACVQEILQRDEHVASDTGAIYGVAGSVSTSGVADRLITGFIDTLYKV